MNPILGTIGSLLAIGAITRKIKTGSRSIPDEAQKPQKLYDWTIKFDLVKYTHEYFNVAATHGSNDDMGTLFLRHPILIDVMRDVLAMDLIPSSPWWGWGDKNYNTMFSAMSLRKVLGIPLGQEVDIKVKRTHPEEWGDFAYANSRRDYRPQPWRIGKEIASEASNILDKLSEAGIRLYPKTHKSIHLINEEPVILPLTGHDIRHSPTRHEYGTAPRLFPDYVPDPLLVHETTLQPKQYLWSFPLPIEVEINFKSVLPQLPRDVIITTYGEGGHFFSVSNKVERVKAFVDFERLYHLLRLMPVNIRILPEKGYPNKDTVRRR